MNISSPTDESFVALAQQGDMAALDVLVRRHQAWVFNLALRMVWRRTVPEDAAQEILIKAVTHLGSFAGRSQFRTWLHRIAVNHLLNVRKSEMEEKAMTFTDIGESLDAVMEEELPDEKTLPVTQSMIVEETRLGCITAMLMCLDRRQRLAFILGEVMGEESETAAAALDVTPANFRQLLSRARHDLYQFMNQKCGLVNQPNPCRCARKASGFMRTAGSIPQTSSSRRIACQACKKPRQSICASWRASTASMRRCIANSRCSPDPTSPRVYASCSKSRVLRKTEKFSPQLSQTDFWPVEVLEVPSRAKNPTP